MTKPMLASDWDETKVKFPVYVQPKIDGLRGLALTEKGLTGRSLKQHANKHVTAFFSDPVFFGLDGEMAADADTNPALCRLTTSALSTIEGEPWILWHVFDLITKDTVNLPYRARYQLLIAKVRGLQITHPEQAMHLRIMPCELVETIERLEQKDAMLCAGGFEGSILRDPDGMYKAGRSTVREGGLLRIKRFVEKEFTITGIQEGQTNTNVATTNELGNTQRSSHQANMVPNGMVGAFTGVDLETGATITVAAGTIPHDLRKLYFEQPALVLQKVGKYKTFPKGVKDKPRFPTFQSLRAESDMP